MAEPNPLTLGLVPPQLRAMGPQKRKPLGQVQALYMLKTVAEWVRKQVPQLRITITESAGSVTIYAEVTGPTGHGSGT